MVVKNFLELVVSSYWRWWPPCLLRDIVTLVIIILRPSTWSLVGHAGHFFSAVNKRKTERVLEPVKIFEAVVFPVVPQVVKLGLREKRLENDLDVVVPNGAYQPPKHLPLVSSSAALHLDGGIRVGLVYPIDAPHVLLVNFNRWISRNRDALLQGPVPSHDGVRLRKDRRCCNDSCKCGVPPNDCHDNDESIRNAWIGDFSEGSSHPALW